MTDPQTASEKLDELASSPDLAEALASDQFKQFLDHVPVAIVVSELSDDAAERIVYVNRETNDLLGLEADDLMGQGWSALDGRLKADPVDVSAQIIGEHLAFRATVAAPDESAALDRRVEINSAVVTGDDDGRARFRLIALIDLSTSTDDRDAFEATIRDKDVLLRELQHRVKNNLQIITSLIRMEARRAGDQIGQGSFERLAGRVEALGLLYRQLEFEDDKGAAVDLGALLSQICGSVIRAQAVEGVRLVLEVEPCPTGINVAMPVGLLVNELMTNAMKYAFERRAEGVVTVRCLKDGEDGCAVSVSDDGVGMAAGATWPQSGKLGALMVRSLKDNTKASIDVGASSEGGVSTTIRFRLTPPTADATFA